PASAGREVARSNTTFARPRRHDVAAHASVRSCKRLFVAQLLPRRTGFGVPSRLVPSLFGAPSLVAEACGMTALSVELQGVERGPPNGQAVYYETVALPLS